MTRPVEKLRGYTIAIITARERDLRRTVADVPRARRAPLRVCAAAGGGARHTRRLPRRCRLLSRRVGGGGRGERTGGRHPASADEAHPPTYPRVRACALPSAVAYKAARRCRMWPRGGRVGGGARGQFFGVAPPTICDPSAARAPPFLFLQRAAQRRKGRAGRAEYNPGYISAAAQLCFRAVRKHLQAAKTF